MDNGRLRSRAALESCGEPHIRRLAAVVDLDSDDRYRLRAASATARALRVGETLSVVDRPVFMVSGWACRSRILSDGRRQVFSHLLPGDYLQDRSTSGGNREPTIVALIPTIVIDAPIACAGGTSLVLRQAYRALVENEDRYLKGQILRLGRLSATERLGHLFLELGERLRAIEVGDGNRFPLPISQEIIADTLGLTTVHVNRTLQSLRRDNVAEWKLGHVELTNPAALASRVYFDPMPPAVATIKRRVPHDQRAYHNERMRIAG